MIQTPYIKVDETGIYILRDFQHDTHLDFNEIIQIRIKKGFRLKNWLLAFILGILFTFGTIMGIIESLPRLDFQFITHSGIRLSLLLQLIPWILFIFSLMLVFHSVKTCQILVIDTEVESYRVPIREIEKDKKIEELILFLKDRVNLIV